MRNLWFAVAAPGGLPRGVSLHLGKRQQPSLEAASLTLIFRERKAMVTCWGGARAILSIIRLESHHQASEVFAPFGELGALEQWCDVCPI